MRKLKAHCVTLKKNYVRCAEKSIATNAEMLTINTYQTVSGENIKFIL